MNPRPTAGGFWFRLGAATSRWMARQAMADEDPGRDAHARGGELTLWAAVDVAPMIAELEAEAQAAGDIDPGARHELAYLTPELIADAATARRNMAAREAEATRPLTPDERVSYLAIVEAERDRLGLETLDVINPI